MGSLGLGRKDEEGMNRTYDPQGNREGTLYDANGNRTCCDLMGMPGYPPQETQADLVYHPGLPAYYQGKGNGATQIGFSKPLKQVFRGQLQEPLVREDLDEIELDSSELVIGADKRLYEPRRGLIDCITPVVVKGTPGHVYVDTIDWDSFPPMGQLAHLFDEFFSKYDREVLMIVGKLRNGSGWLFHVPKQTGSAGLVEWAATDGEMEWFSGLAKWIGTIHVHPGAWCTPSKTDVDDWAEPEKTGLHLIFGRNADYTINGAIAGRTFELEAGSLKGLARIHVEWTTSGRRPLNELLLKPNSIRVHGLGGKKWNKFGNHKQYQSQMPIKGTPHNADNGEQTDFVEWMFNQGGMLKVRPEQLCSMKIVPHNGSYYLVTQAKWLEVQEWANNLVDIPEAKNLTIYPVKGGRM